MSKSICIHNGRIWSDGGFTGDTAIIIEDGDILMTGDDMNILRFSSKDPQKYQLIDAGDRVIFPGFIDSHVHLSEWARRFDHLDLEPFKSLEETLEFIKVSSMNSEWVIGGGWNQNLWPERRWPNRHDLSFLKPGTKAIFYSKDFHTAWVNDEVIDMFNLKSIMKMISRGFVEREPGGRLSGLLREDALSVLLDPIMEQQSVGIFEDPDRYFREFHARGLTSLHSMESYAGYYQFLKMYQFPHNRGIRLGIYMYEKDREMAFEYGLTGGKGGIWYRFLGLKAFLDGALGSQTAWLRKPYMNSLDSGKRIWKNDDLYRFMGLCEGRDCGLSLHAIGDAAVEQILDVADMFHRPLKIPLRIEHAQLLDLKLMDRIRSAGFELTVNPSHLYSDRPLADYYWGDRSRYAFPFKSLKDRHIRFAFASDAPVECINPWKGIAAAVFRDGMNGREPWYPEEIISLGAALSAYTSDAAHLSREGDRKGSLKKGYVGDCFIASANPYYCDPETMSSITSCMTVIDGRIVYDKLRQE